MELGDGSNSAGRQLRPRKSVLTDISNKLSLGVSQITDATKKAVVGKKRKLSTVINSHASKRKNIFLSKNLYQLPRMKQRQNRIRFPRILHPTLKIPLLLYMRLIVVSLMDQEIPRFLVLILDLFEKLVKVVH